MCGEKGSVLSWWRRVGVLSWLFWLDGFGFFGELGWIDSIMSDRMHKGNHTGHFSSATSMKEKAR
ncbi:hypothetical protein KTAU_13730 [Thermogemmatispora aurantia]|uniref:Uncharacterized protein n=1 Tax=Thermogemmatispora aurantia TaxID=2045279 RepID=A0A5J4K9C9_9CHLR|nr:hypothetical protein KTAU_13730 [Thermogemmatispora aurantia]